MFARFTIDWAITRAAVATTVESDGEVAEDDTRSTGLVAVMPEEVKTSTEQPSSVAGTATELNRNMEARNDDETGAGDLSEGETKDGVDRMSPVLAIGTGTAAVEAVTRVKGAETWAVSLATLAVTCRSESFLFSTKKIGRSATRRL